MTSAKNLEFEQEAQEDIEYWKRVSPAKAKKIAKLIEGILETPYYGLGKPEALKYEYSGCWSRRIDDEHRLIYRIADDTIIILSCRFHYQ